MGSSGKNSTRRSRVLYFPRDHTPSAVFYRTTQVYSAFTDLLVLRGRTDYFDLILDRCFRLSVLAAFAFQCWLLSPFSAGCFRLSVLAAFAFQCWLLLPFSAGCFRLSVLAAFAFQCWLLSPFSAGCFDRMDSQSDADKQTDPVVSPS